MRKKYRDVRVALEAAFFVGHPGGGNAVQMKLYLAAAVRAGNFKSSRRAPIRLL